MKKNLYLVLPKLIEQPTWGGDYILQYKDWASRRLFRNLKIGQSYELFSGSMLHTKLDSSNDHSFTGQLGYAMEPDKTHYQGNPKNLLPLRRLVKSDPPGILGKKVLEKYGPTVGLLIKFTQAKGNSFQIHVRKKDESEKWRFKAESWYYFEPGLLTLGVRPNANWPDYQSCCLKIDKELTALAKMVKNNRLTLTKARAEARALVKKENPWQYVNSVRAKRGDLIDLSPAGIHHSWEEDDAVFPLGNIVYEICLDVMDPVSVLRSFDKGKIKEDGVLRKLNINEYFMYIDRSPETNKPSTHRLKPEIVFKNNQAKVTRLLDTSHYAMDEFKIKKEYAGQFTRTDGSYHHLFVKQGVVCVRSGPESVKLTKGHSIFIPCRAKEYRLINQGRLPAQVIKTFIG